VYLGAKRRYINTLPFLLLIFRRVEGSRLSWPESLVTNRGGLPLQTVTQPSANQARRR